jgi:hypothetical protein
MLRAARPTLYIIVLVVALLGTYVFKLRTQGIFACPATGYAGGSYLGYCNATAYGEYDHGAFWYELEPEAERAAANADVLFLGNSRMEFGFSARSTAQWFGKLGIRHYLMGFTFLENVTFTTPLLQRLKPRAQVYIIDVDQFFVDDETGPGGQLLHGVEDRSRVNEKRIWQAVHRPLCGAMPRLCGNRIAFFRFRDDGHWLARGSTPEEPETVADEAPSDQDHWQDYVVRARQFVSHLPVTPDCVILTLVPSPTTRRAEAEAIAAGLGRPLVAPPVEKLRTFDDTHLDEASAQRWSEAFLTAAGNQIRGCLKPAVAASNAARRL